MVIFVFIIKEKSVVEFGNYLGIEGQYITIEKKENWWQQRQKRGAQWQTQPHSGRSERGRKQKRLESNWSK